MNTYIELRPGEQWRDVADAFTSYCTRELRLDQCAFEEGDAARAPQDGKRYAAIYIRQHSSFLNTHLLDWAYSQHRAFKPWG